MKIHQMWEPYPSLAKELETTLSLMERNIQIKNEEIEQAILSMIRSGGKLLRPAYQLLFSQFGKEENQERAVALAASLEMLHTATLIHDDIVDEADIRRNLPTIRSQFGNQTAVYAGDYLLICCFKLLADYSSSLKSIQLNSLSIDKILSGELGQMDTRYDTEMTVDQYIENISGKTAELFALSCFIGAYESGCSLQFANKCKEIGKNIGLAFQIIDDILDYTQSSSHIGKPVLEDMKQGVYSLPLLYALKKNKKELLPYLKKKDQLSAEDTQAVYQLVHTSGGVKKAQQLADAYTKKALKSIQKLPDTEKQTKRILLEITEKILVRTS
ncbi:polyprenyl synthetase family protein [Enterococcus sp. BWB1-3]|uniref:polyprenyl synthetase family protein n=1 Tax=unclassified Enterococcus TaxID=2608891 RepID=UPI001923AF97|nr:MULTISPECIES: polyprenyl synthetase family protein [unclassified Enterococcus]MBL1228622.1 polyprenyl synthetase family protein [Enterococcus sp. BWB1-3]MCB5953609.1 polyprenyl synthetase family protein [Enterococcus sp. CWB-B31]